MYRKTLIALLLFIAIPSYVPADDDVWKVFNFSKTTPDDVTMLFGPLFRFGDGPR